jgi:hypothetical protein
VKDSIDNIQASISKADLVHNLIGDLRVNDTGQDLALIGLDRSIGDITDDPLGSNRLMVVQIAHTIYLNRVNKAENSVLPDPATLVALQVMNERCDEPTNPAELSSWCSSEFSEVLQNLKTLAAAKGPGGAPSKLSNGTLLRDTVRPATKAYVAAAFTAVVYIQYSSAGSKDDAEELRHAFNDDQGAAIIAPEADFVQLILSEDTVRYFHPEDQDIAEKIADIGNQFFRDHHSSRFLRVSNQPPRSDVPQGQIEVWLH